ncbi:MAG: right-handed parallel beta-helix repeat-containing protein [Phycisphaerae bacterium]
MANTSGGGIYIGGELADANYPQIVNCLIVKNESRRDGGGISTNWYATAKIKSCTIADNNVVSSDFAIVNGGGLYCSYGSITEVNDSIIWGNIANEGSQIALGSGDPAHSLTASLKITHSDIDLIGGASAEAGCIITDYNNITANPLFAAGPLQGSYYLSQTLAGQTYDSNCVDRGSTPASVLGTKRTTRTDLVDDANALDLGYHYDTDVHKHTLTVAVPPLVNGIIGGTIDSPWEPGVHEVYHGIVAELRAVTNTNYRVSRWIVYGSTAAEPNTVFDTHSRQFSILMNSDKKVAVEFEYYTRRNIIVPDEYETIQEAVDNSENGDVIYVMTNTDIYPFYTVPNENGIDLQGKAITIRSADPNDPNVVANTVIDCRNSARAFIFQNSEGSDTVIKGLTIINGRASGPVGAAGQDAVGNGKGGAMLIGPNAAPTISNCVFTNCKVFGPIGGNGQRGRDGYPLVIGYANGTDGGDGGDAIGAGYGGAIYCDVSSSPAIKFCQFNNNTAQDAIAGSGGDGGDGYYSDTDNSYKSNGGDGGNGGNANGVCRGGAIYCETLSNPSISGCIFTGNTAVSTSTGGGVAGSGGVGTTSGLNGMAGSSVSSSFAGAVYCAENSVVDFNDCIFKENSVLDPNSNATDGAAGAIYSEQDSVITIAKSKFSQNTSFRNGGAVYAAKNTITLTDCSFGGNATAYDAADDSNAIRDGGALYLIGSPDSPITVKMTKCVITGNSARWGGGIYAKFFIADFDTCYINNNSADSGGGLYLITGYSSTINGGIISGNTATGKYGRGGGLVVSNTSVLIANCTISDNTSNFSAGGILFQGVSSVVPYPSKVNNCLFKNNSAVVNGGAIVSRLDASPIINNCTFDQHRLPADGKGSAVFCEYNSFPTITNCIFNKCRNIAIYENIGGSVNLSNCLFYDNRNGDYYRYDPDRTIYMTYDSENPLVPDANALTELNSNTGGGNVAGDPLFVTGDLGDYYLSQKVAGQDHNSPAINKGNDFAANIPVLPNTTMADYTTRTDSNSAPDANDADLVDIGFHYINTKNAEVLTLTTQVIGTRGVISPVGTNEYYEGTIVQLTTTADLGWERRIWTGTDNDSSTNATNYVVMVVDRSVTVSFEQPAKLYVPTQYPSLQHAIDAAKGGDKIILAKGTYQGNDNNLDMSVIYINGKNVIIAGSKPDDPCTVAQTILSGNGFTITNTDRTMVFDGITIQDAHYYAGTVDCSAEWAHSENGDGYNGYNILGGAMRLYNASPTIRNCRFVRCSATGSNGCEGSTEWGDGGWAGYAHGGAIGIDPTSNPLVKNCDFIDCYVQSGSGGDGATRGHGGNWGDSNSVRWDFGPYQSPSYYSGKGGAIYCGSGSKPEFENCFFQGNTALSGTSGSSNIDGWPNYHYAIDSFGGAVYIASESEPKFTGCIFISNEADTRNQIGDANRTYDDDFVLFNPIVSYGGAVCAEGSSIPVFKYCTFTDNIACAGGAMYWENSVAHISKCNFEGSTAMFGGGILLLDSDSIIFNCNFVNNHAVDPAGQGGAIYSASSASKFYDCQIMNNTASESGGGAYFSGEFEPNMHNCLITSNTAGRDGAGISANWDTELTLSNCTIANNLVVDNNSTIVGFGGGLSCAYDAYARVINSILWYNRAEYGSEISIGSNFDAADKRKAKVSVYYSDVQGGAADVFADYANGCILDWNDISNFSGTNLTNPWFISGPFGGNYYLSQLDANDANYSNPKDSNCVDAGLDTAIANDMYRHTTRTDHVIDIADSNVDMGYHYTLTADIVGDFDFDGDVDFDDLAAFMEYWMHSNCSFPYFCHDRDITEDGEVDFIDYALFTENYGDVEKIPPKPDPMTWAARPSSAGATSITMTATTARDNSGSTVQYYFDCVSGGNCSPTNNNNDRDWDPCSVYTNDSLTNNVQYGYRVKARDARLNETGWSVIGYAITGEDTTPPNPDPMIWATVPSATSPNSIRMVAADACDTSGVEYYFDCVSPGCHDCNNNNWQSSIVYEDSGLDPNTTYTYRVKARDKSSAQNETQYSIPMSATTLAAGQEPNETEDVNAPLPDPSEWLNPPSWYQSGSYYYHTMTAVTATDASQVFYYFECVTNSDLSSDWQESPTYTTTKMTAVSHAGYRVWTMDIFGNLSASSRIYHTYCGYTFPCQ